ncbi:hypothetical protein [Kribbella sp. NPDC004536]
MTILEQLANVDTGCVAEMIQARRHDAPDRTTDGWNNKSSWDN